MRPPKTAPGALRASQEAFTRLQNAPEMCAALGRENNFEKSVDLHEKPQHAIWPTVTRFEHILGERHFYDPPECARMLGREHIFKNDTKSALVMIYRNMHRAGARALFLDSSTISRHLG